MNLVKEDERHIYDAADAIRASVLHTTKYVVTHDLNDEIEENNKTEGQNGGRQNRAMNDFLKTTELHHRPVFTLKV